MGHGKPLGSFGQGTDFYGEGEMVSLVGNLQDFFMVVACIKHEDWPDRISIWIASGVWVVTKAKN